MTPRSEDQRDTANAAPGTARQALFERLDALGLSHRTVDHEPIYTVEEGREIKKSMPGGHTKNLFVKDKKGSLFLIIALGETEIDLVALGKALAETGRARGRFSFASPDLMETVLGVTPGSVTPFALINDTGSRVDGVILDKGLFSHDPVWFHPLENNASTAIAPADLVAFIRACGQEPTIVDFAGGIAGPECLLSPDAASI